MEEAFCDRIIITVALPTHALEESIGFQKFSKIRTGILNSPVRMEDETIELSTSVQACTAVARELAGFIWAIGRKIMGKKNTPVPLVI